MGDKLFSLIRFFVVARRDDAAYEFLTGAVLGEEITQMRNTSWTVVYYMGGTEYGEWRRALPVASKEDAQRMADEIERGGRCALINRTEVWDAIGMPEGAPRRSLFSRQNPVVA